jgi:hypothetical protein
MKRSSKDLRLLLALRKLRQRRAATALDNQSRQCLKLKEEAVALSDELDLQRKLFLSVEATEWQQMLNGPVSYQSLQRAQQRLTDSLASRYSLAQREHDVQAQHTQSLQHRQELRRALCRLQTECEALEALVKKQSTEDIRHADWIVEQLAEDQPQGDLDE